MACNQQEIPRKTPLDGPGPRGGADCYYTSRVNRASARYNNFIKRLRVIEGEQAIGAAYTLKENNLRVNSSFFIQSERRGLINNVERRIKLCLTAYDEHLNHKRQKLVALLNEEEQKHIEKLLETTQAGAEAAYQDKVDRLNYLQAKAKKEHEEKFKETPTSKCVHVRDCIRKIQEKEQQEIHLYQMKEKQAIKMSEHEMDMMWHAVTMKEAEIKAARIEQDAIRRMRHNNECNESSRLVIEDKERRAIEALEQKRLEHAKSREMAEENKKIENDEALAKHLSVLNFAKDMDEQVRIKEEFMSKKKAEEDLIQNTWMSLNVRGTAGDKAQQDLRTRKRAELDVCNKNIVQQRRCLEDLYNMETDVKEDVSQERNRCKYLERVAKMQKEAHEGRLQQIEERKKHRDEMGKKLVEEQEYYRQVHNQQKELQKHHSFTLDEQAKKRTEDLTKQIAFNKLLKEREIAEEKDQRRKADEETTNYRNIVNEMQCRKSYSVEAHPFMKMMNKGLQMQPPCSCSSNYCKTCIRSRKKL